MRCQFKGCSKDAIRRGYCSHHYSNYHKGDKKIGVYVICFNSSEGAYYYVGKSFSQDIDSEVSKHKSAIRRQEKGKDRKLQECFEKIRREHEDLDIDEVIEKYITYDVLFSYDALGGQLLQFDENGICFEVTDNDSIKKAYLKKYEDFIFEKISANGLRKDIDFSELTEDERKILRFISYEYEIIDRKETQKINEYKEKYGEYCLNSNKVQ